MKKNIKSERALEEALAVCTPYGICDRNFIKNDEEHIPRCHYLEKGKKGKRGAILIGINPGTLKYNTESFVISAQQTRRGRYMAWKKEYVRSFRGFSYYNSIALMLLKLKIEGDLLWTDTIKCETHSDVEFNQNKLTINRCIRRHLIEEIKTYNASHRSIRYDVFIFGNHAWNFFPFEDLKVELSKSHIIGVPHPSYQHLIKLLNEKFEQLNSTFHSKQLKRCIIKTDGHGEELVIKKRVSTAKNLFTQKRKKDGK
jgi:hypothetical protein